jgi:hypothetical protein
MDRTGRSGGDGAPPHPVVTMPAPANARVGSECEPRALP